MGDPKGEKPHPEHPHEDDSLLDFSTQHEDDALLEELHGQDHAGADAIHPLDELEVNSSNEEFQFTGPIEELDFTEPADFTFPSEAAEAGAVSDSSGDMEAAEHAGMEHLFDAEEVAPHDVAEGELAAETSDVELADKVGEKETKAKPKRELPAWVRTLEWTGVALVAIGSVVGLFVSIIWLDATTSDLILNIGFPAMLLLIPYALWRSSRRWMTPSASALFTVLLAISAAALIGGTWVEGMELSRYGWQFNKARLAAGKPRQQYTPPVDAPADSAK